MKRHEWHNHFKWVKWELRKKENREKENQFIEPILRPLRLLQRHRKYSFEKYYWTLNEKLMSKNKNGQFKKKNPNLRIFVSVEVEIELTVNFIKTFVYRRVREDKWNERKKKKEKWRKKKTR